MSWLVITRSDSDVTSLLIFPTRGSAHPPAPAGMWAGRLIVNTDVDEVPVVQSRMWVNRGDGGLYSNPCFNLVCGVKTFVFELSKQLVFYGYQADPQAA